MWPCSYCAPLCLRVLAILNSKNPKHILGNRKRRVVSLGASIDIDGGVTLEKGGTGILHFL